MARPYWHAEDATERTVTSTTVWVDGVSLTFTPNANKNYVAFWSCLSQNNNATYDGIARLYNVTTSAELHRQNWEAKEVTTPIDYRPLGGMFFFSTTGSPVSTNLKIQILVENAAVTHKGKEFCLTVIELNANDAFAESVTRQTNATSTPALAAGTLTFTPGTSGDYLIVSTANYDHAVSGTFNRFQWLIDDTVIYTAESNEETPAVKDLANSEPWGRVHKITLTAAQHTVKLMFDNFTGGTAGLSHVRHLAFRLSDFDANFYDPQLTLNAGTQATYQDIGATVTETTAAAEHLVIAAGEWMGSSATYTSYVQLLQDASVLFENMHEPVSGGAPGSYFFARVVDPTAAQHTWKIQRKSESTSTTTSVDGGLAVVQIESVNPPIAGTLTATLAAVTLAGTGTVAQTVHVGTLSRTLAGATLAGTGTVRNQVFTGTLTATLAGTTLTAAGTVAQTVHTGTLTATLGNFTVAGVGKVKVGGALASTLAATTVAGVGTVANQVFAGSLTATLAAATVTGTGTVKNQVFAGTLTATLDNVTIAAAGKVTAAGALAATLAAATVTASGTVANQVFAGTLAGTLAGWTLAGVGKIKATGSLAATLAPSTVAGTGTVADHVFVGTVTATLDSMTLAAAGTVVYPVAAWDESAKNAHVVLSNFDLSASCDQTPFSYYSGRGNSALTIGAGARKYFEIHVDTYAGGFVGICNASQTFGNGQWLGLQAHGIGYTGDGSVYLNNVRIARIGTWSAGATICVAVVGAAWLYFRVDGGNWNNDGSADPANNIGGIDISSVVPGNLFPAYTCQYVISSKDKFTGNFGASGFSQAVPAGFSAFSDLGILHGTLTATLGASTLAGTGTVRNQVFAGTLTATLASITAAGSGTVRNQVFTGTLAATLASLTVAASGKVKIAATLAATLDSSTIAGAGTVANRLATGTLAAILEPLTLAGAARVEVKGRLSVILDRMRLVGIGVEIFGGTFEEDLRTVLLSGGIERVTWAGIPQGEARPLIVLWTMNRAPDQTMDGESGLKCASVRMDSWGDSVAEAVGLSRRAQAALDGVKGRIGSTDFQGIFAGNPSIVREAYRADDRRRYHRASIELDVWTG